MPNKRQQTKVKLKVVVHKVHIQDKNVKEQRADRCSLESLENDDFSVHLIIHLSRKIQ
jgi:hypothetical protein